LIKLAAFQASGCAEPRTLNPEPWRQRTDDRCQSSEPRTSERWTQNLEPRRQRTKERRWEDEKVRRWEKKLIAD